jgi:pimeloyl-ACP methyl ester carboxylesterase
MVRSFRPRPRAAVVLLALAACGPDARGAAGSPAAEILAPCRVHGVHDAWCGTIDVPEDRDAPEGRRIELAVTVIPALDRVAAGDPLFVLVGGPGQAATEVGPLLVPALERIHRRRDIVLVDQRGTGSSNPLDCSPDRDDPVTELRELVRVDLPVERLQACLAGYDADPRLYTTTIAMDDLDEVRQRLGYERISLWGGSYGTRAALVYLRRHGDHVRTAILDGAAPAAMELPLHMAGDGQRALSLAFDACRDDPACAARHPDLRGRLDALLARLGATPATVRVAHPRTGADVELVLERDAVVGVLQGALYAPETAALIPGVIESAVAGDFAPLLALAMVGDLGDSLSWGMFLSVVCAEDVPWIDEPEIVAATEGTTLGRRTVDVIREACRVWPRGEVPDDHRDPVHVDVPVLVLSGELDPVTPPRWGEQVAGELGWARHVVVPSVGHGTWSHGCVPDLLADFLEAADPDALDTTCVERLRRPPFFLDHAGPPP